MSNSASDARSELLNSVRAGCEAATEAGKKLSKLKTLIQMLLAEEPLAAKYKDHPLKHNWAGYRDAHVEPDWVLIYAISEGGVRFERTGTHEELFEKM